MHSSLRLLLWRSTAILGLISFFTISAYSQNQKKADSLKIVLREFKKKDSSTMELLREIALNERDPNDAIKYSEELIKLSQSLNNFIYLHRGHLQKGQALREKGEYSDAIDALFESAKAAKKANYQAGIGGAYIALADTYSVNENHTNSTHYYNLAIKILRQEQDSITLATALLNAGDEYLNARKLDSALVFFEESGSIFQEVEYLIGTVYNLGNMGMVHALKGEHHVAKNKMALASSILKDMGDFYPIAVYDLYISDIYKESGDLKRALEYAQHSLDISKQHALKEQIRDANLKLSELYDAESNYQKAYFHQSQYLEYRDSINNEEKIREIADLRTEYEVNQRETEIALLKTEQRNQYIIFVSMAVIIILLALASFLYYRNSKRKQTLNLVLTERKEEIEAQRDQLEAINETREKFLSIISHDLMGPVNSFKGLSAIMKLSIEKEDKKDLLDIHQVLNKTINNMSNLLTNLLDWSVTQKGSVPYRPQKLSVEQLSTELFDLFFNTAESKKIHLISEITAGLAIWADENSVKTILRNLVSNALKFTEEGGAIEVIADRNNGFICIQVKDSGMGMSEEKINLLLSENTFERSQGTKGEKGVGLGLQLVKEFTEMNKGKLEIESEIDKGTTFRIYLPDYSPLTSKGGTRTDRNQQ